MSIATMLSRPGEERMPTFQDGNRPMSDALLQAAAQAAAESSQRDSPDSSVEDHGPEHDRPTKRPKRSRACQACRGMKIRCLPVEGQEACKACSKVNRTCVMPGPARKRQKTVHKVAELEQKINALTASLAAKGHNERMATPPTESPQTVSTPSVVQQSLPSIPKIERSAYYYDMPTSTTAPVAEERDHTATVWGNADARMMGKFPPDYPSDGYVDVISRNKVSEDVATAIFDRWKREMCHYCPIVTYPESVTVDWLRRNRPISLLAILAVACGTIRPALQSDLMVELSRQIAERVSFLHEKAIDLIHAMMIMPIWSGKHKYAKDLNFNHIIHSAVAMCLDLGFGKRSGKEQSDNSMEDLEKRRTWMGCYYLSGTVATVLRLPQLVKFSPYLEECLECVSKNPNALPGDKLTCSLVRLMHITEDVGLVFHMDDPGSSIQLNDSRTQYHLKMFERQLEEWKESTRGLVPDAILDTMEAVTSLYIHEIALHNEHNVDDFRPIAHEHIYGQQQIPSMPKDFLTNAHLEALACCVDSMERAMVAFNKVDNNILRGLPCLHMVWMAYVSVAMIRLYGILQAPDTKYGSIFLPHMRVEHHLDTTIQRLTEIAAENTQSPAEQFLQAFRKLRAWQVIRSGENVQAKHNADSQSQQHRQHRRETGSNVNQTNNTTGSNRSTDSNSTIPRTHPSFATEAHSTTQSQPQQPGYNTTNNNPANATQYLTSSSQPHEQQQQYQPTSLLDPTAPIDASTFDIGSWDFNMNELSNFDTYMNEAGWMGYLL